MKIFVSYSWDNDEHNDRVLSFVAFLRENGFNANFDKAIMQDKTATHFGKLMVYNIQSSDKIIVVLSEGYKNKADNDIGGVATEYGYILNEIDKQENKYILVSFISLDSKTRDQITPFGLAGREIIDLVIDERSKFENLFSKLSNMPIINLPPVSENRPTVAEKEIKPFSLNGSHQIDKDTSDKNDDDLDLYFLDTPTKFFDYRMSQAFPGIRGVRWFTNPKEISNRLEILLRQPLKAKNNPIWWFRGYYCLHIDAFRIINENKFLVNEMECLVDKLCIYKSQRYDRSFVYIELKPESPIGVYEHDENYVSRMIDNCGYAKEEYAIYKNNKFITREEYDDGAAYINDSIVNFNAGDVELRERFLSRYNFLICAIFNPINSDEGDNFFQKYLNAMLNAEGDIREIVNFVENLPRHKNGWK